MLATGNHIAYVATLYRIISIFIHQTVGGLHVPLIVTNGSRCFMVHHQTDALGMSIFIQILDVKIGIRSHEIENIILGITEPVFPTRIPTLHQYLVKTVFGSKVYVLLHISRVGRMNAVRFHLGIVRIIQFHRREVKSICPGLSPCNHFPPYADIFHRLNPGGIIILARLIQIENQIGGQYLAGIITDYDRTPGSMAGRLHIPFISLSIRSQPGFKNEVLVIQVEMHARVVHQGCLVQVKVHSISCFKLYGSLDTCRRKDSL